MKQKLAKALWAY